MPVPFAGQEFSFTNPDGSEIAVVGWGDQFHSVFESLAGYTIVKHPETGYYHYARLSDDASELLPTPARVGVDDPELLGVPKHIRVTRESAKRQATAARDAREVTPRWEARRQQRRARLRSQVEAEEEGEDGPRTGPLPGAEADDAAAGATGTVKGLCLLIAFPDVPATIPQQEIGNFCNQPGYNSFGNNGSVYDYFLAVSAGRLQYTNIVTAYYTSSHNRSYYTDPAVSYGVRAQELIVEALGALKAGGFDFGPLTSDSAGYVRALNVFYAGGIVNNWAEGLWPHSSALANAFAASASKKLSDYQITDVGTQLTLRTFCHENGHMVCDFPDLYDYGYQSAGVGNYCLMCYGGSDTNPVEVCGYLKNQAGWAASAAPMTAGASYNLRADVNEYLTHRKNTTEYFILENREQVGRDGALPDSGLAIWHVDELGSNNDEQMTPSQHYECSLEQADGRFDLEHNANAGDADDLFGAPGAVHFGTSTAPNSRWWDGASSGLEIEYVSPPGPTIVVSTQGAPTPSPAVAAAISVLLNEELPAAAPVDLLLLD